MAAILATAGVLVAVEALTSPAAQAAEVPWDCGDSAFLFQSPNNAAAPHQVQAVDLVTGDSSLTGTTADQLNAVGYNPADNFMYAWNLRTHTLDRVSSDLSLINLGEPANTPVAFRGIDYNVGDFDDANDFWIMDNQTGRWLEISLANPNAPVTVAYGIAAAPAGLLIPGDWAFLNGEFYAVAPTTTGAGDARLVSFNPATRTFTNRGILTGLASGSTFGAAYSDDAYLYVSRNQGGNIYRVNPATVTGTFLSTGPPSSSNDGARCRSNIIPTVTLIKNVAGRLSPDDQFTVTLSDAAGNAVSSVTTTGSQTTASTIDQPVEHGETYIITDSLTDTSPSRPEDYTATLVCTTESGPVGAPERAPIGVWELTIGTAHDYTCTVTNTPDEPNPQLTLSKSVSPQGAGALVVDNTLTYQFVVTNTGNVPISVVKIADIEFSGAGTMTTPQCQQTDLAPNEFTLCTATYVVQQADVDAGTLSNTALATGEDPDGNAVSSNDDGTQLTEPAAASLTVEKRATPAYATAADQDITYEFDVTNTGNVTITNPDIVEVTFNGSGTIGPASCAPATLLPGETATCKATYTITQADMDAGAPLTNVAHATGEPPDGGTVSSDSDDAEVTIITNPHLTLVKDVTPTTVTRSGDAVTYSYTVTNSGNVTISDLEIVEEQFTGTGLLAPAACEATTLTPGSSTTCRSVYTFTQTDIDAGEVTNAAHATGQTPGGDQVESLSDDAIVGVVPVEALELTKVAAPSVVSAVGDEVTYTYTVTNSGTTTVSSLTINEVSFTGTGTPPAASCDATTLAPAATTTCLATYHVTQADLDSGRIDNIAQAAATSATGGDVVSNEDDASVTTAQEPSLEIEKSATPATVTRAGQLITYRFKVTNNGNITLTNIRIIEDSFTGAGRLPAPTCPATAAQLAPAEAVTCSAVYRVTAADLAKNDLSNNAHATGETPAGVAISTPESSAVVNVLNAARSVPAVHTRTSDRRVSPGQRFWDHVRITGLVPGTTVPATARLYGPFSSRAAATCRPRHLARTVTWQARNGMTRSPAVRIHEPGVYTWQVTTGATAVNESGTHRCRLAAETTTVAKPAFVAPIVNGGFSGTLLDRGVHGRAVLPVVRAPGIGLHASVLSAGVVRGHMVLPSDVDMVSWLRKSAGYGDKIGTTVIAGHVSDRHDRPGAMWRLSRARVGRTVTLTVGGVSYRYKVTGKARIDRDRRLPHRYFKTTGRPRLALISCTDKVVYANGHFHYTKYQVVLAKLISAKHAR